MKLTKETLKRIIKEELDNVVSEDYSMNEDEGKAANIAKAAKEMADSAAMDPVFAKMAKDPEVMKAVQKLQSDMNEGVFGMDKDSAAGVTMMGTAAAIPSASAFLGSAAGKLLMAKAAAAVGVSAATLGTAAVGFLAPIALGFAIDALRNKAMK